MTGHRHKLREVVQYRRQNFRQQLHNAGIFGTDKRWKILCGGILAIFIKFWAHVFSGVIFFSQNAWDGWGAWGYSLTYHISSKIPEGIFSLVILMILPLGALRKAAKGVSRV